MSKRARCKVLVLLLLVCLIWGGLSSCRDATPSFLAYREQGFSAEIRGTLNRIEIDAKVTVAPRQDGYEASVEYLGGGGLDGVSVSARCNGAGEPIGKAEVRLSGKSLSADAGEVYGLLLPATAWLMPTAHERVRKNDDGYLLHFPTDILLQLDDSLSPRRLQRTDADFWIVWLEKSENTSK